MTPAAHHQDQQTPWHALDPSETSACLEVNPARGLGETAAAARLERFGENGLAEKPPRSKWLAFLDQFRILLIL